MVKMVSLSDDVYMGLKLLKGRKSFSEIIRENIINKKKKSIKEFIGIWKEDSEYWNNFEKEIRKSRNSSKMREVNL